MSDLFHDKAADWDRQPVPLQISQGVSTAIVERVPLSSDLSVMDFGAGTGLLSGRLASRVGRLVAVDVSPAMLAQLAAKPELAGRVEVRAVDLLAAPLAERFDLIVSAMAMHHVEDTAALLRSLRAHLAPGGQIALADLDAEDGSFHPPGVEGVFHAGFERAALGAAIEAAGFSAPRFTTACVVHRDGREYPVFLVTASAA